MEVVKTYKREVATIQLVVHWLLVAFICFIAYTQNDRDLTDLVSLATGMAVWVYGFAAAAFGLDAVAKQMPPRVYQRAEPEHTPPEGFGDG